jgi:hypothetical protein
MKNKLLTFFLFLVIVLFFSNVSYSQSCCPTPSPSNYCIFEDCGARRLMNPEGNNFNCHQFVRMYIEGNCRPSWANPFVPSSCSLDPLLIADYSTTGYYVQVCDESVANVARYQVRRNGNLTTDHSQVKDVSQPGKYISKYDYSGPLVGHVLDKSYYRFFDPGGVDIFYSYLGKFVGNNPIQSCPVYFSVNNIPTVKYSWSIVNDGTANVLISSATDSYSVKLTPIKNGTDVLKLETWCLGVNVVSTQLLTLQVSLATSLNGSYDNAGINNQCLNTVNRVSTGTVIIRVNCPGAQTYTWQKTSGNINGYFPNGPTATFNMTSGGSISFLVTAKNSGGGTIATRSLTFYNGY